MLVPLVTPVLVVLVGLIVTGMLLVAAWAAATVTGRAVAAAVTGRGPAGTGSRATFRQTFVAGCRRTGLCLFGWPDPADAPGETTILSL